MVRMQIRLTERQQAALRRLSASTGRPVADLIRQSVEQLLSSKPLPDKDEQIQRAMRVAGRFRSGRADGSSDHDRHLARVPKPLS
jgi:predicted DNA-binding protein